MPAAARLTLEVDVGSDPISGRISDDVGTRSFSGWLDLGNVLQAMIERLDESPRPESNW